MVPMLTDLDHAPDHDDEFDAIAIGITALAHSKNMAY
jgi:Holliday junction resolvasome RuvABC endonuclease subunit